MGGIRHLGYQNNDLSNSESPYCPYDSQDSVQTTMSIQEFQDGYHEGYLRYLNGMILANLNRRHLIILQTTHLHTNDGFNGNLVGCISVTWRLRIAKNCSVLIFKMATISAILKFFKHLLNQVCSN